MDKIYQTIYDHVHYDGIFMPPMDNHDYFKYNGEHITDARVFACLGIEPTNQVQVVDELYVNGGMLVLVHYVTSNEDTKDCRGVVVYVPNEGECRVVCRSFPYTPEYVLSERSESIVKSVLDKATITRTSVAHEGSILRIFWFEGTWYFSTHKRIDGRNSRWTGETFMSILKKNCDLDVEKLNKSYCYTVLIEHPDTIQVCGDVTGSVYHVLTYDMTTGKRVEPDVVIGKTTQDVEVEDVLATVYKTNPRETSGVFVECSNGTFMKLVSSEYANARLLRNNQHSLSIRYLELYPYGMHETLRDLFPEGSKAHKVYDDTFKMYENIAEYLGHIWYRREFKGEHVVIDKKIYEGLRYYGFFEKLRGHRDLKYVKAQIVHLARTIGTPHLLARIIKQMKRDYEWYHETQNEWSKLFS